MDRTLPALEQLPEEDEAERRARTPGHRREVEPAALALHHGRSSGPTRCVSTSDSAVRATRHGERLVATVRLNSRTRSTIVSGDSRTISFSPLASDRTVSG